MNNKKTTLLAAAAAVGLTTTLLGATASFAQDATSTATTKDTAREAMHQEMKTFHDSIETTVKAGDFNAWKEQMLAQNQKMKDQADAQVTQENFDTLKKAHDLKEAGKNNEARELMKNSNLRGPGMMGMNGHEGERRGEPRGEKGERPADAPADAQK
jgi:hypothetical protein